MVDIIGYTFDADIHCLECTQEEIDQQFLDMDKSYLLEGLTQHEATETILDSESNSLHPIFDIDECLEDEYCGDCKKLVNECNFLTKDVFDHIFESMEIFNTFVYGNSLYIKYRTDKIMNEKLTERNIDYLNSVFMHNLVTSKLKIVLTRFMYDLEIVHTAVNYILMKIPIVNQ